MKLIPERLNKISIKYYRLYLVGILIWGIVGLITFPMQGAYHMLITASGISLWNSKGYSDSDDKARLFVLCCLLSVVGLLVLIF